MISVEVAVPRAAWLKLFMAVISAVVVIVVAEEVGLEAEDLLGVVNDNFLQAILAAEITVKAELLRRD